MKPMVFTNKMCFNILIQGFNEALECLEMKEFLYTPSGMAYNDHQSNMFINREGVPDLETKENDNRLIVNYRLKTMMEFAFFRFMDRQQVLAESKYCINSSEFYRKCLNALNIELTKRNSKKPTSMKEGKKIRLAPFFELDDPDPLQYLSVQKWQLERRAFRELKQPEAPSKTYTPKLCFKPELIDNITKDLNSFFDASQHAELKRIIETGNNTQTKLLFRDNGNRLSDYFKRLFEKDTITGCDKKDLINWIVKNFKYTYRKTDKEFIPKTVEKTISGNLQPCKNPIT